MDKYSAVALKERKQAFTELIAQKERRQVAEEKGFEALKASERKQEEARTQDLLRAESTIKKYSQMEYQLKDKEMKSLWTNLLAEKDAKVIEEFMRKQLEWDNLIKNPRLDSVSNEGAVVTGDNLNGMRIMVSPRLKFKVLGSANQALAVTEIGRAHV